MHSFTSPHDISWMVVCRHRVFPKSVIGLAQLLGNADRLIDSLIPITWSQEELSAASRISYQ